LSLCMARCLSVRIEWTMDVAARARCLLLATLYNTLPQLTNDDDDYDDQALVRSYARSLPTILHGIGMASRESMSSSNCHRCIPRARKCNAIGNRTRGYHPDVMACLDL